MTSSLERWLIKDKDARAAHEVKLALLDINPVFYVSVLIFYLQHSLKTCGKGNYLN